MRRGSHEWYRQVTVDQMHQVLADWYRLRFRSFRRECKTVPVFREGTVEADMTRTELYDIAVRELGLPLLRKLVRYATERARR